MSLKIRLNNLIAEKGYISYDEMVSVCKAEGRKPSNGERRLRPSDSPMVEAVLTPKGAIRGYRVKPKCDCCGWDDMGYTHEPNCAMLEKPEENKKEIFPKGKLFESPNRSAINL